MLKDRTTVLKDNYSGPVSRASTDTFRQSFGYWTSDKETGIYYNQNDTNFELSDPLATVDYSSIISKLYNADYQKEGLKSSVNHTIVVPTEGGEEVIKADEIHRLSIYKVKNKQQSVNAGNTIIYDTRFRNMAHRYKIPASYDEIKTLSQKGVFTGSPQVDVEFHYLRETGQYEESILRTQNEYQIPNYYDVMLNPSTYSPQVAGFDLNKLFSISEKMFFSDPGRGRNNSTIMVPPENINFFNSATSKLNYAANRLNILQSHEVIKDAIPLDKDGIFANTIPYHVRISINPINSPTTKSFISDNYMFFNIQDNSGTSELPKSRILFGKESEKYDLGTLLMRWVSEYFTKISSTFDVVTNDSILNQDGNQINDTKTASMKGFDLIQWLSEYAPSILTQAKGAKFVGGAAFSAAMATSDRSQLINIMHSIKKIFTSMAGLPGYRLDYVGQEIYKNILELMPSYEYMVKHGGEGISETLFYKVEKYLGSANANSRPIQTFYIPRNKNKDETVSFIDTQVVYGKRYSYVIKEFMACYSMEYEYVKVDRPTNFGPNEDIIAVKQYPKIKIMENTIFQKSGRILAPPPMPPEFEVIPIRKQDDKFKIVFKPTYGSYEAKPVTVSDQDRGFALDIINNSSLYKNKITYSDLTTTIGYTVYYSNVKPRDPKNPYATLNNRILADIRTKTEGSSLIPDSATALMKLNPNTKYYLTFVSKSRLAMNSMPTAIYEFEMIKDSGYSYLQFKELTYSKEEMNEFVKDKKGVGKLFSIRPNLNQTTIDFSTMKTTAQSNGTQSSRRMPVAIGSNKDKIFPLAEIGDSNEGKQFKIRIRSTNTNKYFDINLKFKHERIESKFDRSVPFKPLQAETAKPDGANPEELNSRPAETPGVSANGSTRKQAPFPMRPAAAYPPLTYFYDNPEYDID